MEREEKETIKPTNQHTGGGGGGGAQLSQRKVDVCSWSGSLRNIYALGETGDKPYWNFIFLSHYPLVAKVFLQPSSVLIEFVIVS